MNITWPVDMKGKTNEVPETTLKFVSDSEKTVVPLTDTEELGGRGSIEGKLVNGFEMKKIHSKREIYLESRNEEQIYGKSQD